MLKQERAIGVRGLNLGADPVQQAEGWLQLADGIRYLEQGAAHSRGGRVAAGLEWPYEGIGESNTYVDTIPWFKSILGLRVRGFAPFYDQRIYPVDANNVVYPLPQRLNFLYKSYAQLWFNYSSTSSDIPSVSGSTFFNDINAIAKIVVHGDKAYIVEESTPPKVFRRLPAASQVYLSPVRYNVDRMGIVWPTTDAATQKPTLSTATITGPLPAGTYRFRIVLENQFGVQSGPSIPVAQVANGTITKITVDWSVTKLSFPAGVTKVRVYVQMSKTADSAIEASDYLFLGSAAIAADTMDFQLPDHDDMRNRPSMRKQSGAPPILRDIIIINDVAYGAAASDIVYREVVESEVGAVAVTVLDITEPTQRGQGQGLVNNRARVYNTTKLTTKTTIRKVPVDPSYLFWSDPGEPEYMENYVRIGNGTEFIVGFASAGQICVIFTNQSIYTFDANELILKRVYSRVGALSRDSIVETEQGIRFIGSDGVPRIFNGATVDETADELIPIFDRDDYNGDYLRFDRASASDVSATSGKRKFYMTYSGTASTTFFKPGVVPDSTLARQLVVGDASHGRTQWSIDRTGNYDAVYWLGRESRLLAISPQGDFFYIEEGETDLDVFTGAPAPIDIDIKTRRFASANGLQGQFYKVALDIDTKGQNVTLVCTVDLDPALQFEATVNTASRDEFKTYLPATFKGRYIDVRLYASVTRRVGLWGVFVESAQRGLF